MSRISVKDNSNGSSVEGNLTQLLRFDQKIKRRQKRQKLPSNLIGIDEVGRGCLAGPVVAAAVCLPTVEKGSDLYFALMDLNDSKKLSASIRERLAPIIESWAWIAIDEASPSEIDEMNIFHASLLAMKRALIRLIVLNPDHIKSSVLLVDGNKSVPDVDFPQIPIVKGDSKSASIAAASVVAKVHRDKLMTDLACQYPDYHWDKNKGYGSSAHKSAIDSFGITVWHRRSFSFNSYHANDEEILMVEETEQRKIPLS